jgi:hypothetical protein
METIIEPNSSFDFSKLSLALPTGIQGGAYFTKIEYNTKPLYIQTCKSSTKQGFVKSGKKYYCDLMFDKNAEVIINWFENLEEKCKNLIYEKRDVWFQNNLEETDIDNSFSPLIRVYKSGKYYLLRTNVKNSRNDEPLVKIYNENENKLNVTDLTSETNIISILEIQGIKFTSKLFQIEIEIKQMMVLDGEKIFENCLIKTTNKKNMDQTFISLENNNENKSLENINSDEVLEELPSLEYETNNLEKQINNVVPETFEKTENIEEDLKLEIEDLNGEIEENIDELKEVNIHLNLEDLESIQLKKPNQVYFDLYKEARNKAKIAKKNAILAYLEAKNIKKTYMLDNLNDSDSDFDAEIDEVSESELEGLEDL